MVAVERELPEVTVSTISADAIPPRLRRHGGTPRQVVALTLVGTLLLAVFASHDLSSWLDRMGDAPVLVPLQRAAAGWDAAMTRLGLSGPPVALRGAIHRLLDWRWANRD